jgi:hypothetical protein
MELIILILIAGVAGYLLAGSRLSKPIDDTTDKVTGATRNAAENVEGWFSRTFRREKKPKEEVVEAKAKPKSADKPAVGNKSTAATKPAAESKPAAEDKPVEDAKPAAKQSSRRRSEAGEEETV